MSSGSASRSGAKRERGPAGAGGAAAAIDEGIEHQPEELVGHLERDLLAAGRGFAGELAQRIAEIAAGEAEDRHEAGRQRAAVVEEVVERAGDVLLVGAQAAGPERVGPPKMAVRFRIASVAV